MNNTNDDQEEKRRLFWKRKLAMAIGRPDLVDGSDDDLQKAHDDHMSAVATIIAEDKIVPTGAMATRIAEGKLVPRGLSMPQGSASVPNIHQPVLPGEAMTFAHDGQRQLYADGLINAEAKRQGIKKEVARVYVQGMHPDLFPKPKDDRQTPAQTQAYQERCQKAQALIKEKMANGCEYNHAFSLVRTERPDLFTSK